MIAFPQVGERFGDYLIDAELGRGGMGIVFRATQLSLNRPVALKVLDPKLAADDEFVRRFGREATILASMSSPHVIQVHDHGQVGSCLYLATQYVAGGDLSQLIARHGAMEPPLALDLTGQILSALADAHARGVIHRDVKPSNVLLTSSAGHPFAYLCDFGIAQSDDTQVTRTGAVIGSWGFMAPERHQGSGATAQSDIYSAGCLLWCALTGRNPYEGTDVQVAMAHISAPVPQLDASGPLADRLNELLARSLAKHPADRFASAADFLHAIRAIPDQVATSGRPLPAGAAGAMTEHRTRLRPDVAATTLRPTEVEPVAVRVAPSRGRRTALVAGIVAVALLGAGAIALGNRPDAAVPGANPSAAVVAAPTTAAPATSAAGSAAQPGYVCWDGTPAADLQQCTMPNRLDGLHYLYPSMAKDIRRCDKGETISQTKLAWECHYGGKDLIKYSYWGSTAEAEKHYQDSYSDVTPQALVVDGERVGTLYVRNSLKAGLYRMSGVWLDGRFGFSVQATTRARWKQLAQKVRMRAMADVRGYREDSTPATVKPNLP